MPDIQNIPTTQYIGPRIIPHLWDPILWDASTQYDALAVVQYEGAGYVARYVPPQGTPPTDTEYWVKWADFNAQLAGLQQTVDTLTNNVADNAEAIEALDTRVDGLHLTNRIGSPSNGTMQALYRNIHSYIKHGYELVYMHGIANAFSYGYEVERHTNDFGREGFAINCTCFTMLNILGVDYEHSRYNIPDSQYQPNIMGSSGYCFNPYGEAITPENFELYSTAPKMCQRMFDLGIAEYVSPDLTNVYPGDVIFNYTGNVENPTPADAYHSRIVLATNLSMQSSGGTEPLLMVAEARENRDAVCVRCISSTNLANVFAVAHIPYQNVEPQKIVELGTMLHPTQVSNFRQLYNTHVNGIVTLEFDFQPSSMNSYVNVLVDDNKAIQGGNPVAAITKPKSEGDVGVKKHYVIPCNTVYADSGYGAIQNIRVNNTNHISGYDELTNVHLYDGFGNNSTNVYDTVNVASLTDLQNAILARVSSTPYYGYADFRLPFRAAADIAIGNTTINTNMTTYVDVHAIYGSDTAYLQISGRRYMSTFEGTAQGSGSAWTWTWN